MLFYFLVAIVLFLCLLFYLPKKPEYKVNDKENKKINILENDSIPFRLLVQSYKQGN
jgi:septation ring formation regulator EzrA